MNDPKKKYGLLAGLVYALWLFLEYYTGMNKSPAALYTGQIPTVFFILFIILAIYEERKRKSGILTFSDGMRTGLGLSAIGGIIFSVGLFIYFKWVNTAKVLQDINAYRLALIRTGKTAQEAQQMSSQYMESYAFQASVFGLLKVMMLGLLLSLIFTLILRRENR